MSVVVLWQVKLIFYSASTAGREAAGSQVLRLLAWGNAAAHHQDLSSYCNRERWQQGCRQLWELGSHPRSHLGARGGFPPTAAKSGLYHHQGRLIPPRVRLQRGWQPRLSTSVSALRTAWLLSSAANRAQGIRWKQQRRRSWEARISLGLAAQPQPQCPRWVSLEQAQTGSVRQSMGESPARPNPRLLLYPKPSSLPAARWPPPAHQSLAETCSPEP